MYNYLYFQHEENALSQRFDIITQDDDGQDSLYGIDLWSEYVKLLENLLLETNESGLRDRFIYELADESRLPRGEGLDDRGRSTPELLLLSLLNRLRFYTISIPSVRCPRVFISHRRIDGIYALRMAQLAYANGFSYWVDILNPSLIKLAANVHIPQRLIPLLTACIIEMGLINCTHVLAIMTPNTLGSQWLPYEYGRITEIPGLYQRASAWQHPALGTALPEYMLLGEIANSEYEVGQWLQRGRPFHWRPGCLTDDQVRASRPLPNDPANDPKKDNDDFEQWLLDGCPLTESIRVLPPLRLRKRGH